MIVGIFLYFQNCVFYAPVLFPRRRVVLSVDRFRRKGATFSHGPSLQPIPADPFFNQVIDTGIDAGLRQSKVVRLTTDPVRITIDTNGDGGVFIHQHNQ